MRFTQAREFAHPPAPLRLIMAGEALLPDCLPGLRTGISFDECELFLGEGGFFCAK